MYKEEAQFFLIYIREAHPSDGWQLPINEKEGVVFKDPENIDKRKEIADCCIADLKLSLPVLIDDMNDTANKSYSAWPDRIFIVDKGGKIVYRGGPGPKGFRVEELADELDKMFPEVKKKAERYEKGESEKQSD